MKARVFKILFLLTILIGGIWSCSTEKNTAINRLYHGTCARYNGLFNANELIRIGLEDYRRNHRENFNEILPLDLYPNEEDVMDFYPVVDTAIKKCETVISKHSMPTASKPSKKKTEHANWVDQNWLTIAKARYLRRNFELALEDFEYIKKFFMDRSSTYEAQLWKAKCEIQLGYLSDAQRTLSKLDNRYNIFLAESQGQNYYLYKRKMRKLRNAQKKTDKPAPFPKRLLLDVSKTKAELSIAREDYESAINHLKEALKHARKKDDKSRINFIIGQILLMDEDEEARKYFNETIKRNPPFEMGFQARIKRAMSGGREEDLIIEELDKMNGEPKYMEYRDQIYFAMANVELGRNEVDTAKMFLTKSAMYSLDNPRQKGMSYELLGDISFEERNYVNAQKYFDSSAQVIPESYVNYELIHTKAEKLAELVKSIDIVYFEDSVQRIAGMGEEERDKFLEDVIEQLKEEERIRKEKEAARAEKLRELQMQQMEQSGGQGSRFYFNNVKSINEGFDEFRQVWGARENENDWRRSNKPLSMDFEDDEEMDSVDIGDLEQEIDAAEMDPSEIPVEELTPEILMKFVPMTDSALAESNMRLLENLYKSGMVYKEQLEEPMFGAKQFQRVVDHGIENEHNVLSAFQLYEIYEEKDPGKQEQNKTYILENYPESDYANYLRDPDYFIKKKEMDAIAQKEYLKSVERYERGLYFPVIMKAKNVIEGEPENIYRAQYFILKAMAMGRTNNSNSAILEVLEQAIEEFPETAVADRAQELIDLINDGFPPFEPIDFDSGAGLYNYSSKEKMTVLIFLNEGDKTREVQSKVSDFNREFFSRDRLNTGTKMIKDKTLITVGEFKDEYHAGEYLRDFKKTKKYLRELRNNKLIFISEENLKIMLKEQKTEDYEQFFDNTY